MTRLLNSPDMPDLRIRFAIGEAKTRGNCFVIGLETPDLLVKTLESLPDRQDHNDKFKATHDALSAALQYHVDEVPIPGSTPIKKIAALMRDTGIMAHRLDKPLCTTFSCARTQTRGYHGI